MKKIGFNYICDIQDVNKPVNIFIHGLNGTLKQWEEYCQHIDNYLCVDLPSHGYSNRERNLDIYSYANKIFELIKHLGFKKVNLIGHSFGGTIALILSKRYELHVEKCILINSCHIMRLHPDIVNKNFNDNVLLNKRIDIINRLKSDLEMSYISISSQPLYFEIDAIEISVPCIVIYSKFDKIISKRKIIKFIKSLKNVNEYELTKSNHYSHLEEFEEVFRILKKHKIIA